jgi:hypothetical protein
VGVEIFRTCPHRPWGLPSLLYNGCRVFPRGKERPGRDADPSPPTSAVGHERVEVYIFPPLGLCGLSLTHSLTHSQALRPMQGLGRLKKSPPTISTLGLVLPISDSQSLCIPHHFIHPSKVWPSHSPSALRLVQGDFLTW